MRTPLDMGDLLSEIEVPDIESAQLALKEIQAQNSDLDLFAEKQRKGWDKTVEARCDFTPHPHLIRRSGLFFLAYWRKSVYGKTLTEIKADDSMVHFFANTMVVYISDILGPRLDKGNWCIITTPKRRHLVKNFATRISEEMASRLSIPFYEDVCSCRTRQRVNAVFDVNLVPEEQNIICFDDFVTTGQTLKAMGRALEPCHKNLLYICGIDNKL